MKSLLLTGGCGFIGSNYVNYMSEKYPDMKLIVIDKLDYCASLENIIKRPNVEIIIGDLANKELVTYILNKFEVDTIAHIGASTHVDNSFFNSIEFTHNNVLGTHILLETVRIYHEKTGKINKFLYASTDEIYGEILDGVARVESSIYAPTNPYAATKLASELMCMSYFYSYKIPVVISRGNNAVGVHQYPEKLIPKFICKLLNNEKLTIQGQGTSRRNFIHVYDTCTAFETILLKGQIGEIYNISADHSNEYSVMNVTKILIKLFYPDVNVENPEELNKYIESVEDRKFNDTRYFICSKKLEKLGWIPVKTNFIENLKELITWYKENKSRYGF